MAFSVSPSPGGAVPAAPAPDVPPGAGAAPVVPAATTLAEAVELFIARTRHTKTGSAHTEQAYRTDLRHLGAFLTGRRRSYHDVVRRDAALYLSRLATRYAPRTVRRRISTCRSFYRFLRGIELVAANPFDALDLPSFDRRSETHKVLTDEEHERVLALLRSDVDEANRAFVEAEAGRPKQVAFGRLFAATRRRAALTLMGLGGLRCAEVLHLSAESIIQRPDGFYLRFAGKGEKVRTVPLVGFAYPAVFDWLSVRRHVPAATDRVLVTLTGRPVRRNQMQRDCRALGDRAEVRVPLTPHVLRRTFATRTLKASGDLRAVQDLLGHASISTTEVYTFVAEEGLRSVVEGTGFGAREHQRGPVLGGPAALPQPGPEAAAP